MANFTKGTNTKDWRITLLGTDVQLNQDQDDEEGQAKGSTELIPMEEATDKDIYKYMAILFVANYCPHCKLFAPHVVASAAAFEKNKCKVLVCTNDRDEDNFAASCVKTKGLDMLPYDLDRTKKLRDLFGLETIPALIILENSNFQEEEPRVITNGRHILQTDPNLLAFPWESTSTIKGAAAGSNTMSAWDRLFINGKYGKWYHLGHQNVSPNHPEAMYMDEHSVRIRAGVLNTITWFALMNVFFFKEPAFVYVLFPIVAFEFLASGTFGLAPLAPIGTFATLLSIVLHPNPVWKPANPKRFAWAIGLVLATSCFVCFLLRDQLGGAYRYTIGAIVLTCNVFTWLESSAGFCFGCFVYNTYLVPMFQLEECNECKI